MVLSFSFSKTVGSTLSRKITSGTLDQSVKITTSELLAIMHTGPVTTYPNAEAIYPNFHLPKICSVSVTGTQTSFAKFEACAKFQFLQNITAQKS